jgi:hypothetical protein
MRRNRHWKLWSCTSGIALTALAFPISAQGQITGNLATTSVNYGEGTTAPYAGALSVQTITSAFGASTYSASPGPEANGSELDAAYGASANGYLYLFLSGNLQDNGNLLNVFIQAGSNGNNTLEAPTGAGTIQAMNGSIFSPGFAPTYAFELNDTNAKGTSPNGTSTAFIDQFNLTPGGLGGAQAKIACNAPARDAAQQVKRGSNASYWLRRMDTTPPRNSLFFRLIALLFSDCHSYILLDCHFLGSSF